MRFFKHHIFLLFLGTVFFASCSSHMRSGKYVFKEGKWVFVHDSVGFMNMTTLGEDGFDPTTAAGRFMWPVPSSTRVSSHFGPRKGKNHEGIDIPATRGASVVASEDGKVIYSGKMRGYGRIVIVKHDSKYHTVYAHNESNLVRKGQKVSKGEVIAKIGTTGRATGPHLHFEIRRNNQSRNPASYMPVVKKFAGRK